MENLGLKKYQHLFFGLTIAVVALYYTMHSVSFSEVALAFKMMDYKYIIPALLIMIITYVFRAYRWQALLESTCKVSVWGLYSPMMVGYLGNFLPARAAEIFRPYLLSKKYDLPFSTAFASIVMERLFDLIMLMLIFVWVFWFEAGVFSSEIKFSGISVQTMAIKFGQICLTAIGALMVFIYLLLRHKEKVMLSVQWFTHRLPEKWGGKINSLVEEFSVGCEVTRNFGTLTKITIYSVLVWMGSIVSLYPLYFAFDLQNKTAASVLILSVMTRILITIAPTPGFLGSYNAGVFIALHEIMNESEAKVVSFGLVGWALCGIVVLVGGFYFTLHEHMSIRSLMEIEKHRDTTLDRESADTKTTQSLS